jgi:hypothetical protein
MFDALIIDHIASYVHASLWPVLEKVSADMMMTIYNKRRRETRIVDVNGSFVHGNDVIGVTNYYGNYKQIEGQDIAIDIRKHGSIDYKVVKGDIWFNTSEIQRLIFLETDTSLFVQRIGNRGMIEYVLCRTISDDDPSWLYLIPCNAFIAPHKRNRVPLSKITVMKGVRFGKGMDSPMWYQDKTIVIRDAPTLSDVLHDYRFVAETRFKLIGDELIIKGHGRSMSNKYISHVNVIP